MIEYEGYDKLSKEEIAERIWERKRELGERVIILAHHYQLDDVFGFADFTGDSLKLSRQASEQSEAEYIVFCGVHFMAEVARMLCNAEQKVILPDIIAGCSLADYASYEQVERCWRVLSKKLAGRKIIPVTYINSLAEIKAFCGRNDGVICTSGNADRVLRWAFDNGDIVLFLPDQHLGRNSGYKMGIGLEQMLVYDSQVDEGGLPEKIGGEIKMILWNGCCDVHMQFDVNDVQRVREEKPEVKIIVHPECKFDVVQAADYSGSTEFILKSVRESSEKVWAIGTERDMVARLANEFNGRKEIFNLSDKEPYCPMMKQCDSSRLLWVLDNIAEGVAVNEVFVDERIIADSQIALERMLGKS